MHYVHTDVLFSLSQKTDGESKTFGAKNVRKIISYLVKTIFEMVCVIITLLSKLCYLYHDKGYNISNEFCMYIIIADNTVELYYAQSVTNAFIYSINKLGEIQRLVYHALFIIKYILDVAPM